MVRHPDVYLAFDMWCGGLLAMGVGGWGGKERSKNATWAFVLRPDLKNLQTR
jgi:hypothetical protein